MKPMSRKELREVLAVLELSQVGAARFLNSDARTMRRWVRGEHIIPTPIAMLLRLMVRRKLTPEAVRSMVEERIANEAT